MADPVAAAASPQNLTIGGLIIAVLTGPLWGPAIGEWVKGRAAARKNSADAAKDVFSEQRQAFTAIAGELHTMVDSVKAEVAELKTQVTLRDLQIAQQADHIRKQSLLIGKLARLLVQRGIVRADFDATSEEAMEAELDLLNQDTRAQQADYANSEAVMASTRDRAVTAQAITAVHAAELQTGTGDSEDLRSDT